MAYSDIQDKVSRTRMTNQILLAQEMSDEEKFKKKKELKKQVRKTPKQRQSEARGKDPKFQGGSPGAVFVPPDGPTTDQDIQQLKGIVGGEANYANMIDWAQKSLNQQEVQMFDQVMAKGDPLAAFFAVRSLAYAYNDAVGYDGNMVQGKAPRQSGNQFRSQQEVLAAMGDPRYDNDPAYRKDVMDKLERSPNVNF